ncbi:hypothetical protein EVG20_g10192 [Dentipellis fragilis]|uniref:Uncharacterized protein n=1 Tax=Dentipellis fragilis TaxID=205917 RepID=A0A4Y9XU38_9AGAM|nr:hypothetical protein EVG20_g10192 [Dentipellis fragilis]
MLRVQANGVISFAQATLVIWSLSTRAQRLWQTSAHHSNLFRCVLYSFTTAALPICGLSPTATAFIHTRCIVKYSARKPPAAKKMSAFNVLGAFADTISISDPLLRWFVWYLPRNRIEAATLRYNAVRDEFASANARNIFNENMFTRFEQYETRFRALRLKSYEASSLFQQVYMGMYLNVTRDILALQRELEELLIDIQRAIDRTVVVYAHVGQQPAPASSMTSGSVYSTHVLSTSMPTIASQALTSDGESVLSSRHAEATDVEP